MHSDCSFSWQHSDRQVLVGNAYTLCFRAPTPKLKIHTSPLSAPRAPRQHRDDDPDTTALIHDELTWTWVDLSTAPMCRLPTSKSTPSHHRGGVSPGTISFPSPVKRLSPMFWRL